MKKRKMLLVCWYDPAAYSTIIDHINSFLDYSNNEIEVLNLFGRKKLRIPNTLWLRKYDGIVIHNTLSYNIDNVRNLDQGTWHNLANFKGLKVLMKQDESLRVNKTIELLRDWNFDLLMTCVPEAEIPKVYSPDVLKNLKFLNVLTGYITPDMQGLPFSQKDERKNDVVYRGMQLPFFFGELSREKYTIGEDFKEICKKRDLQFDISSKIEDRVFGDDWYRFLGTSKASLAVESGASIFDFTGELEKKTNEYVQSHPGCSFNEVHRQFLAPHEGKISYNQISPRHFEAAATKTVQIMFEGTYSGIFEPDEHYLSLKKDYTNIDEIIEKLMDSENRIRLTENAYKDIVMNPKFSYQAFMESFDSAIDSL